MKPYQLSAEHAWLEDTLHEFFAPSQSRSSLEEHPSPEFFEHCRVAAEQIREVAKMRSQRPKLSSIMNSLAEHLRGLALLSGVNIKKVFASFHITQAEKPNFSNALNLARLAQSLGLGHMETELRVRLGFSHALLNSNGMEAIPFALRATTNVPLAPGQLEIRLRKHEAAYSKSRRESVWRASKAVAAVFAAGGEN